MHQESQGEWIPEPTLLEPQEMEGYRVALQIADPEQDNASRGRVRRGRTLVLQVHVDANALNHPSVARLKHWVLR